MGNIKLVHYDDGKKKWQSHEVYLKDAEDFYHELGIYNHDIFDAIGYGETKEEALENLKKKLDFLFDELEALKTMLFETDVLTDNMIEVDYSGKEIVKQP